VSHETEIRAAEAGTQAQAAHRTIETWHQIRNVKDNRVWTWRAFRRWYDFYKRSADDPANDRARADDLLAAANLQELHSLCLRLIDERLPDWILEDFDATAAALDELSADVYTAKPTSAQLRSRMIEAFGLNRQGTDAFTSSWHDDAQLDMARALQRTLDADPSFRQKITAAYKRAAERTPFRERQIREAWERLKSLFLS
jgi:hypothetical protein